eukprot:65809-Pelagomonas_calceolata.AAC.3
MKRVPRTNSRYPLRSRGGHRGNREHSAPATATPLAFRHQAHEAAGGQLQAAASRPTSPKFKGLSSSYPPYHSVRCGRGRLHPSHFEPLKELGLDTYKATRLAPDRKLHAHSVQYAYKLASTRRALEKTSYNSHQQDQARATASNPPAPH